MTSFGSTILSNTYRTTEANRYPSTFASLGSITNIGINSNINNKKSSLNNIGDDNNQMLKSSNVTANINSLNEDSNALIHSTAFNDLMNNSSFHSTSFLGGFHTQLHSDHHLNSLNNSLNSMNSLIPNPNSRPSNVVQLSSTSLNNVNSVRQLPSDMIVDVWAHNLRSEMARIMEVVDDYPYIAMDTEFPGVVARPVGTFKTAHDYHYATLKCNVDLLKMIQLGLCFADKNGNLAPGTCTWQFNFQFSLGEDMYAQDSIDLLAKSGIDFALHAQNGIDVAEFGELLMCSGIVLNEDVRWISFHSSYDFAYLLKLLCCVPLPQTEAEFFELLQLYFPCIYDIKYLMKSCENLTGGLQKVAETLAVERIGPQHQAGSDSLLTAATFFKMREMFFENNIDEDKFCGVLFGLGQNIPYSSTTLSNNNNGNSNNSRSSSSLSSSVLNSSESASASM